MVKINKIYTRSGDKGQTYLVGGAVISKSALRICCVGEIDELNAFLGLIRTLSGNRAELSNQLGTIQNELFDIGSQLACAPGSNFPGIPRTSAKQIKMLEQWIDLAVEGLPELRSFVLPGGNELNAFLHIARCVCRRAERSLVLLAQQEPVAAEILEYINRLSDLLFALARAESKHSGLAEYLWQPGKSQE